LTRHCRALTIADSGTPAGAAYQETVPFSQQEAIFMVHAFVLASVKRDQINEAAQELLKIDGVAEVYSIAGDWDLIIIIRARENDQLAAIVTEHMLKLDSLVSTTTLIGFRAYSNYDLDRMFSIGFQE
jgi:DNA-binding Lrp family transcriptional regulator